jgi:hypothetical protein
MKFEPFPKIPRLFRSMTITEKIDGTNASVWIGEIPMSGEDQVQCLDTWQTEEDGPFKLFGMRAGSRKRWIYPESDNFGFAQWVQDNATALRELGPGHHFGEWWGAGIQRRYGMDDKHFSLFNTDRWGDDEVRPPCCQVVPVLHQGPFCTAVIRDNLLGLQRGGSLAAPGFMNPEGVMVWHHAARQLLKFTLGGDGHKG